MDKKSNTTTKIISAAMVAAILVYAYNSSIKLNSFMGTRAEQVAYIFIKHSDRLSLQFVMAEFAAVPQLIKEVLPNIDKQNGATLHGWVLIDGSTLVFAVDANGKMAFLTSRDRLDPNLPWTVHAQDGFDMSLIQDAQNDQNVRRNMLERK